MVSGASLGLGGPHGCLRLHNRYSMPRAMSAHWGHPAGTACSPSWDQPVQVCAFSKVTKTHSLLEIPVKARDLSEYSGFRPRGTGGAQLLSGWTQLLRLCSTYHLHLNYLGNVQKYKCLDFPKTSQIRALEGRAEESALSTKAPWMLLLRKVWESQPWAVSSIQARILLYFSSRQS